MYGDIPPPPLRSYDDYRDDYGSNRRVPRGQPPIDNPRRSQLDHAAAAGPCPYHRAQSPVIPPRQRPIELPPRALDALDTAPHNVKFVTPIFPQLPTTVTHSCSTWAIMLEQAIQTLEAIFGPLLEATLCECTSMGLGPSGPVSGGGAVSLPTSPYDLATSLDLLLQHEWLCQGKFPVTIRKRLEATAAAVAQLAEDPDSLGGSKVLVAQQAMKGIVSDCLKAMGLPSLLGSGSRQFMAFVKQVRPEFESQLLYYDVLLADCQATQDAEAHRKTAEQSRRPAENM